MTIIERLQEALAAARSDRACFSRLHPQSYEGALPLPKHEDEVDAFIKERIRLHHNSWIVKPLETVLFDLGAPLRREEV